MKPLLLQIAMIKMYVYEAQFMTFNAFSDIGGRIEMTLVNVGSF